MGLKLKAPFETGKVLEKEIKKGIRKVLKKEKIYIIAPFGTKRIRKENIVEKLKEIRFYLLHVLENTRFWCSLEIVLII